jgi:hypothetical protein
MVETNQQTKQHAHEGIVVSDPDGVVIAWRDGLARRFSWDQLRQMSVSEEMSRQSVQQPAALAQPVTL